MLKDKYTCHWRTVQAFFLKEEQKTIFHGSLNIPLTGNVSSMSGIFAVCWPAALSVINPVL